MKKKYQIFISSTYKDLIEERTEVIKAVLNLDGIPVGMEYFPAVDLSQWELITQMIKESDYYILILAGKYGSLADKEISYTEKEYDFAVEKGIPVLTFVHRNIENLPRNRTEIDPTMYQRLLDFRKKVMENKLCNQWESSAELATLVTSSLNMSIQLTPRIGWVRIPMHIQESLMKQKPSIGHDLLILKTQEFDFEMSVFIQFLEYDDNSDSFDGLIKKDVFELEQIKNIYSIDKKTLPKDYNGSVFKLYVRLKKKDIDNAYVLLCSSGYSVSGKAYPDPSNNSYYLIWFLTPTEPVYFASTSVGTINQLFISSAYPHAIR
ncbi:MAG: DUF4062 domain-containing protein [Cyclobacteriaceae bacterium]